MLVGALLTLMFVAVVQLAMVLHVRNVLVDAASEGARHGALAGNSPQDGADRTRVLVGSALNPRYASDVRASVNGAGGVEVVVVEVSAPLPVIGLLGPRRLTVTGHAAVEGR